MAKQQIDLNNVRYFVEVAQSGSFSAAARVFGVPPSMVSRRVARLEAFMGTRMIQRTTRSLKLTHTGEAFLEHARAGMQELQLAQEVLGELQATPRGRVRLTAPAGMSDPLWHVVSRFLKLYPDVRVEMELADRYVDLIGEGFDLAVRSGRDASFGRLIGRRLVQSPRLLLASPDYLKARGEPKTANDLRSHDCVIVGGRADRATWRLQVGSVSRKVEVKGRIAVNEARLAARCAAQGFGIAFLPRAACTQYMASNELMRVLPRVSGGEMSLWLVYPDRQLATAARALAEFLVSELPPTLAESNVN